MKLSEAEWKVMNVLWESSPRSAREVLTAVAGETSWAYTTAKTVLTRLVAKGALNEVKQGNTALYSPLVSREGARTSALRSLLDRAFGGDALPLVQNLLDEEGLSGKDREKLRSLLEDSGPGSGRKS